MLFVIITLITGSCNVLMAYSILYAIVITMLYLKLFFRILSWYFSALSLQSWVIDSNCNFSVEQLWRMGELQYQAGGIWTVSEVFKSTIIHCHLVLDLPIQFEKDEVTISCPKPLLSVTFGYLWYSRYSSTLLICTRVS